MLILFKFVISFIVVACKSTAICTWILLYQVAVLRNVELITIVLLTFLVEVSVGLRRFLHLFFLEARFQLRNIEAGLSLRCLLIQQHVLLCQSVHVLNHLHGRRVLITAAILRLYL